MANFSMLPLKSGAYLDLEILTVVLMWKFHQRLEIDGDFYNAPYLNRVYNTLFELQEQVYDFFYKNNNIYKLVPKMVKSQQAPPPRLLLLSLVIRIRATTAVHYCTDRLHQRHGCEMPHYAAIVALPP